MENSKSGTVVVASQSQTKAFQGIRMENPFAFKAFQVFTGFGFGCGVGIGVGSPINLGAIPMVNQVMSATRGATDAFSGASRLVNTALWKVGAKNIQAGFGCGVGFGHGFGLGLAVKPGVVHKIQSCFMQAMMKLMLKFGMGSYSQGTLPTSLQSSIGMTNEPSNQNSMANIMQLATKVPDYTSQVLPGTGIPGIGSTYEKFKSKSASTTADTPFGRTEKVLSNFLQNPLLKEEGTDLNEVAGRLRSENNILQMNLSNGETPLVVCRKQFLDSHAALTLSSDKAVLKHQKVIEELMEENEKLRQILVEDLKIPPSKLQASYSSKNKSACADCFECRRKQRRR